MSSLTSQSARSATPSPAVGDEVTTTLDLQFQRKP